MDIHTLVESLKASAINPSALKILPELVGKSTFEYGEVIHRRVETNCWGTTLFTLGFLPEMTYVDGLTMDMWLRKYTRPGKLRVGSIRVYRDTDVVEQAHGLLHTEVYLGNNLFFECMGYMGYWRIYEYGDEAYYAQTIEVRNTIQQYPKD